MVAGGRQRVAEKYPIRRQFFDVSRVFVKPSTEFLFHLPPRIQQPHTGFPLQNSLLLRPSRFGRHTESLASSLHPGWGIMNRITPQIRLRDFQALRPANLGAQTDLQTGTRPLSPLEALLKPENADEDGLRSGEIPTGDFYGMIGRSPKMLSVFATLARIASYPVTPLILGEPGSGKSSAARAIHRASDRSRKRMISFDCRLPQEIPIENVLLGEVGGSNPSQRALDRPGLLELAHGGSLYLQEISALPIHMQVHLLRVLESGELRRVGCAQLRKLDVRIITSSSEDLSELCTRGKFRGDLLYRLNAGSVRLPALREVPQEIPVLIDHLLGRIAVETGSGTLCMAPEARKMLSEPYWSDNVRGLLEILRAGSARAGNGRISQADLLFPPGSLQATAGL